MTKEQQEMWNRLKEPEPIIDKYGSKFWYNKSGELHRDNDQPAVIWADGHKSWYVNGKRHRENDQPAVITNRGTKFWYKNGEFIRNE